MLKFLIIALYVVTTSLGLITLKLSTTNGLPIGFVGGRLVSNFNLLSVAGIILYGISFLLYFYLISKFDLGYIIPVTAAFVYVLIFIASYFIFHEVFTVMKIIGISLIVLGLIFLNGAK